MLGKGAGRDVGQRGSKVCMNTVEKWPTSDVSTGIFHEHLFAIVQTKARHVLAGRLLHTPQNTRPSPAIPRQQRRIRHRTEHVVWNY